MTTTADISELVGRVHVCDCLEFMRGLPDGCVDAVVTDPPYGVGLKYAEGTPPDNEWPAETITECLRVASGPVFVFGAAPPKHLARAIALQPDRCYVWSPRFTLAQTRSSGSFWRWHPIWAWRLPNDTGLAFDMLTDPCDGHNWWNHPATKPESLMTRLVNATQGVVLDPFLGSGTTAVVCERLGRRWIGCEINPTYAALAEKRIQREREKLQFDFGEAT